MSLRISYAQMAVRGKSRQDHVGISKHTDDQSPMRDDSTHHSPRDHQHEHHVINPVDHQHEPHVISPRYHHRRSEERASPSHSDISKCDTQSDETLYRVTRDYTVRELGQDLELNHWARGNRRQVIDYECKNRLQDNERRTEREMNVEMEQVRK